MVKEMPATVKRAIELIGLFVLGTIIVDGNTIIMPYALLTSLIIACPSLK